jgi:hypothetical protein
MKKTIKKNHQIDYDSENSSYDKTIIENNPIYKNFNEAFLNENSICDEILPFQDEFKINEIKINKINNNRSQKIFKINQKLRKKNNNNNKSQDFIVEKKIYSSECCVSCT